MQTEQPLQIEVATMLRRVDFSLTGDLPDAILKRAFFCSYEIDRRYETDRIRPHLLIVSFQETSTNLEDLHSMAIGNLVPDSLTLVTATKGGRVVSRRTFTQLRVKNNGGSYAAVAGQEVPLQKFIFECYLAEAEFPKL